MLNTFEVSMLESLMSLNECDEICELEVQCADGSVTVQGLILAVICPTYLR